ncbi:MAG: cell division protein ZapA [Geminicoccaceae bacterium]
MPTIEVTIHGRPYILQCDEGQETRLKGLAAYVDRRLSDLEKTEGSIGDTRLLIMTSLLIADELSDAYDEIKRLRNGGAPTERDAGDTDASEIVDHVTQRIEALAARLENT